MAVASPTATADGGASFDTGGAEPQLVVHLSSDFDLVESGRAIPLRVVVTDLFGVPQAGVPVVLSVSSGRAVPERVTTEVTGWADSIFVADGVADATVRITARSDRPGSAQGIDQIRVRAISLPPPPIYGNAEVVSAGLLSTLVAFVWAESGRTSLAGLFFPLYTRLKRERVLDHFVRGQIFGAVRSRPGLSFVELGRLLGLSNGSLSYHLRILELQGFLRSYREGIHRRFVPAGTPVGLEPDGTRLSDLQARLLAELQADPKATQRDLAARTGVTQQCVSYNLLFLRRAGSIDRIREGRRARYLVVEA